MESNLTEVSLDTSKAADTDSDEEYSNVSDDDELSEGERKRLEELEEFGAKFGSYIPLTQDVLSFDTMERLDDIVDGYNSDSDPDYEPGNELEKDSDTDTGEGMDVEKALIQKILEQKEELDSARQQKEELDSARQLIQKLKEQLECPVCLDFPRTGPIPVCPNGHIVCSRCKRDLCPTCRVEMGQGKSLLATTMLSNCSLQCDECKENILWGDLGEHERVCTHRPVCCPHCDQKVPLQELVDHFDTSGCQEGVSADAKDGWNRKEYKIRMNETQRCKKWPLHIYSQSGQLFAVSLVKSEGIFYIMLIMLASESDCSNFTFDMVIHDLKSEPGDTQSNAVKFQGNPLSIDTGKEELFLYGLSEKFITKLVNNSPEKNNFSLSFKIKATELAS